MWARVRGGGTRRVRRGVLRHAGTTCTCCRMCVCVRARLRERDAVCVGGAGVRRCWRTIDVDGDTEADHLPVGWDGDFCPRRVVEVALVKRHEGRLHAVAALRLRTRGHARTTVDLAGEAEGPYGVAAREHDDARGRVNVRRVLATRGRRMSTQPRSERLLRAGHGLEHAESGTRTWPMASGTDSKGCNVACGGSRRRWLTAGSSHAGIAHGIGQPYLDCSVSCITRCTSSKVAVSSRRPGYHSGCDLSPTVCAHCAWT
jgi:hypothetical protein